MLPWRQNIKVNISVDGATQPFDSCLLRRPSVILNAIKSPLFCAESLVIAKRKLMEEFLSTFRTLCSARADSQSSGSASFSYILIKLTNQHVSAKNFWSDTRFCIFKRSALFASFSQASSMQKRLSGMFQTLTQTISCKS